MYQNQRKIFCFFLRGLRSEQGVVFSHAGGYEGVQTDKPLKINTFYFHRKEVRRWLFFVLKRPVIIRSCQTIT